MESNQKFDVLMLAFPYMNPIKYISVKLNELKTDTTIGQVMDLIKKQTSYNNFCYYGLKQESSRQIYDLIPQLKIKKPRFTVEVKQNYKEILINIESKFTGEKITVKIGSVESVLEIKKKLLEKYNYKIEYQRLFYKEQEIKDDKTLEQYSIVNNDTIKYTVVQQKGKMFSDVSDQSKLEQKNFSKDAPEWRKVTKGINVEGYCKNQICKAFNNMVIDMQGYIAFNLIKNSIKCPLCYQEVVPETCGFYDCQWMFEGYANKQNFSADFNEAKGELYHRFSDKRESKIEWTSLTITVKPLITLSPETNDQCTICNQNSPLPYQEIICGHKFHADCLQQWNERLKAEGSPSRCSICSTDLD